MLKALFVLTLVCGVWFTGRIQAEDATVEASAKTVDVTLKISGMT